MVRLFQKNKTNNYCVLIENYFSGFCNSFFLKISKKRCSFANHSTKIELKNRGVAQLASVLAWGARGRKFESSYPDKSNPAQETKRDFSFKESLKIHFQMIP